MKTHSLDRQNILQRLSRITRILLLAGVAAVVAAPQLEARPERRENSSRHHGHHGHGSRYDRPQYRPAPSHHRRGWSRPGFYGNYPPSGYVDYRYIRSLPRGYRTVYRDGFRYYYVNGNYYCPARYNDRGIYINVRF